MKKTLIFVTSFILFSHVVFAQGVLSDIDGHIYEESILYLNQEGIVDGYPDGTFRPDNKINRAEFLKIIVEANFDEADYDTYFDKECFPDIAAGQWYTKYVCFAKSRGIVEGYTDGMFRPSQEINLSESLKMIYETMGLVVDNPDAIFKFKYYSPAMKSGYIPQELVGGYFEVMTRGQIAEIMYRILIDPNRVYMQDIRLGLTPVVQQYDASCATAALAIALSNKISVTEQQVIDKMKALDLYPNNEIYEDNGKYIWDNPHKVFVGDINGLVSISITKLKGYGFLEEPLVKLAREWAPNSIAFTGMNIGYIVSQLEDGYPVIIFADVNARNGSVILTESGPGSVSWYFPGGNEFYTAPMYKHNMVVEGFKGTAQNPQLFYVVDPFYGKKMDMTPMQLNDILKDYNYSGVVIKF